MLPNAKSTLDKDVLPVRVNIKNELGVQSFYDSRLRYVGVSSGKEYEWAKAGDIVMVLTEDIPALLEKRIGSRSCCGAVNQNGNKVFDLANLAE